MKILIMGLPGSGKTTLAEQLVNRLKAAQKTVAWFNADKVREQFNDWDFSTEGRLRQVERMNMLAENCPSNPEFVICDFVAPLESMRENFNADFTIWLDTIDAGRFEDTNRVFQAPEKFDIRVDTQDAERWSNEIFNKITK